jgi:hypothetical protein
VAAHLNVRIATSKAVTLRVFNNRRDYRCSDPLRTTGPSRRALFDTPLAGARSRRCNGSAKPRPRSRRSPGLCTRFRDSPPSEIHRGLLAQ